MSSRYPTVAVLPGTGPESDEEGGSVSSRGSGVSQAAGPDETLRFTDLVNLHSRACRVVLQPRDGIARVCGNPRATCTRQRHQGMGEDRRAAPGYYVAHGANPEQLQVLWWEFPREHWDALREGSRMNFLVVRSTARHIRHSSPSRYYDRIDFPSEGGIC